MSTGFAFVLVAALLYWILGPFWVLLTIAFIVGINLEISNDIGNDEESLREELTGEHRINTP